MPARHGRRRQTWSSQKVSYQVQFQPRHLRLRRGTPAALFTYEVLHPVQVQTFVLYPNRRKASLGHLTSDTSRTRSRRQVWGPRCSRGAYLSSTKPDAYSARLCLSTLQIQPNAALQPIERREKCMSRRAVAVPRRADRFGSTSLDDTPPWSLVRSWGAPQNGCFVSANCLVRRTIAQLHCGIGRTGPGCV